MSASSSYLEYTASTTTFSTAEAFSTRMAMSSFDRLPDSHASRISVQLSARTDLTDALTLLYASSVLSFDDLTKA